MADLTSKNVIRQIQATNGTSYDIVAKYLSGTSGDYSLDEILGLVQGVVDTYVIKTQTSPTTDYENIVRSENSTVTTTTDILNTLVGRTSGTYKIGDIFLMEETSDGKKVFDRWISNISESNITLSVLETQVATHHHTITLTSSSDSALTGVKSSPTVSLTSVGSAVNVLNSASGTFVTSVTLTGGKDDLALSSSSASGSVVSHSHTVNEHGHTFKPSSLVSQTASAYTTLNSVAHTPHKHTVVSAAGKSTNGNAFNIATGISTSATFIKTLRDVANQNTSSVDLTTNENEGDSLITSTQSSTTTSNAGEHTHSVDITSTTKVVTSVSYSAPSVQSSVMTSVSYTAVSVVTSYKNGASSFIDSWSCSVNSSGILSFAATSATATTITSYVKINRVTGVSRQKQTNGSLTVTSENITLSGTTGTSGEHTHGFSHTHAIPAHTHTIDEHTHTYVKTASSETGNAITSLQTSSYTPHTHSADVGVASTSTNESPINIVTGGTQTKVVSNLKTTDFTTDNSTSTTDTKYVALVGEIEFPGLTAPTGSVSTSSTSITPAVAGTQTALASISFNSASFMKSVTAGVIKTTTNIGGN